MAMKISLLLASLAVVHCRPGVPAELPVQCPQNSGDFPVFLPHPTDCTKYYECQDDWPILMDCAPPLYFDAKLDVCNWPNLVDCVTSTSEAPMTSEAASTISPEENNATDADSAKVKGFRAVMLVNEEIMTVECPESSGDIPVFLPDPTNCSRYYECQGNWPILMECAPPLHFDSDMNVCNWPSVVNCEVSTTEEPVTTTEVITSISPDQNTTEDQYILRGLKVKTSDIKENITVECPESNDDMPVFLPHPANCSRYFQCQGKWAIMMECAPPLHFDPSMDVCNWPNVVHCEPSTTKEPEVTTTPIDPTEETTADATDETTADAAEETTADATEETTADATEETTADATEETTADATEETTTDATEETTADATE